MITLLLILAAALHAPQARHPVRWTRGVGPSSRQALEAKLKRPVKLPNTQKIYEHTDKKREIHTCADYARAKKDGWSNSANTYERTTESFFKDQCDVPLLVLTAKPSRVSYVQNFKLDDSAIDLLPPTLSWILSGDEEQAADDAERQGLSWKKFKPRLKIRDKYTNGMTLEEPDEATIELEIKAFGDFNGDEIEDVLLFKSTQAIKGTFCAYYPVILTRVAAGGPLKAFRVEDNEIEKAVPVINPKPFVRTATTRRPGTKPRNAKRVVVPITNVSGVKLQESPAINVSVVRELGVGDRVEVIRKAVSDAGNGTNELWAFVILVDSRKGDFESNQKGWVLDKYLGYKNRFKKITSWKKQSISSGIGDYSFTIEIRRDGSFIHKSEPCIDCGEKPGCKKGERKVGRSCVSRGHLYRYNNFVWARKPTEYQEYFFIDKQGDLRSVYPEDR